MQTLEYRSGRRAMLSIVAENKTNPIVRFSIGVEPAKKFVEGELVGIDRVDIDGTQVWPRKILLAAQYRSSVESALTSGNRTALEALAQL